MTEDQKVTVNYLEESSMRIETYIQNLQAITKEEVDNSKSDEIIYIRTLITFLIKQGEALGKIKKC